MSNPNEICTDVNVPVDGHSGNSCGGSNTLVLAEFAAKMCDQSGIECGPHAPALLMALGSGGAMILGVGRDGGLAGGSEAQGGENGALNLPFKDPSIRSQVQNVIDHMDQYGTPPDGVRQGGSRGRPGIYSGSGLPVKPGQPLYYVETDVWPTPAGEKRPESGRLLFGAMGEVY